MQTTTNSQAGERTQPTKFYVQNFDGNLMGPGGEYITGTATNEGFVEFGHRAVEFSDYDQADAWRRELFRNGGSVVTAADYAD